MAVSSLGQVTRNKLAGATGSLAFFGFISFPFCFFFPPGTLACVVQARLFACEEAASLCFGLVCGFT